MIAFVPRPPAVSKTICARGQSKTCVWRWQSIPRFHCRKDFRLTTEADGSMHSEKRCCKHKTTPATSAAATSDQEIGEEDWDCVISAFIPWQEKYSRR